jgi:hypothetical protein
MDSRSPLARVAGAGWRAGVMALAVALPQLVLGGGSEAAREVVALFALLAFAFAALEYASAAPSLVEFRDAPPFNRLRASGLLVALLAVSLLLREGAGVSTGERLLRALAGRLGEALDRPLLPVGLLRAALGDGLDPARAEALRAAAGVAYLVSLGMAGTFALLLRRGGWPTTRAFNLWINLPQFDPTAGGDVVGRLGGEANLNLLLGVLLPFLLPVAAGALSPLGGALLAEPTATAWLVILWAFLPASLLMRGLALHRVAGLIAAQRRRAGGPQALQPA